jgi:predicted RNA binding protein YcfA (HicA-like mRNA interferase family)
LRNVEGRDALDDSLDESSAVGRFAPEAQVGVVETALAAALRLAAKAERWEIVAQLAEERGSRVGRRCAPSRSVGYEVARQSGRHSRLRHPTGERIPLTVPDHRELKSGLLRSLIRDAGMTAAEFEHALNSAGLRSSRLVGGTGVLVFGRGHRRRRLNDARLALGVVGCLIGLRFVAMIRVTTGQKRR